MFQKSCTKLTTSIWNMLSNQPMNAANEPTCPCQLSPRWWWYSNQTSPSVAARILTFCAPGNWKSCQFTLRIRDSNSSDILRLVGGCCGGCYCVWTTSSPIAVERVCVWASGFERERTQTSACACDICARLMRAKYDVCCVPSSRSGLLSGSHILSCFWVTYMYE